MKIAYRHIQYAPETEAPLCGERLRKEIEKALASLESAYCGFDNVTDPDLIDCYIYQVNSALKRYKFLLSQVPDNTESYYA